MTTTQNIICKYAIKKFGETPQIVTTMEETAELTQALSKYLRNSIFPTIPLDQIKENIAEEIADVEIMLTQMKLLFNNQELVDKYIAEKLKKLSVKINPHCTYSCFIDKGNTIAEEALATGNISEVEQWCRKRYDAIKDTELFGGAVSDIFYYKNEKLKRLLLEYQELRLSVYTTRRDVDNDNPLYTICINTIVC